MVTIDLPKARRLAFNVVLGQALITLIAALVSYVIAGGNAAVSALAGGGIGTVSSLAMAVLGFRRPARMNMNAGDEAAAAAQAQRAVSAFYVGEAVKLALAVVLFVVVFKVMKVAPMALFAGYMATFFVYWIALANALPALGGQPTPRAPKD